MTRALKRVEGVLEVQVDYSAAEAWVLGSGAVCEAEGADSLALALKDGGYGGRVTTAVRGEPAEP